MTAYGEQLLSKVIDNNDPAAIRRFGIEANMFGTDVERKVAKFIDDYAEKNRGEAPGYATVVGEFPDFYYIPEVTDSYEYLTGKIRERYAMNEYRKALSSDEFKSVFEENDPDKVNDYLTKVQEDIRIRTSVRKNTGVDIKTAGEKFLPEYRRRKNGESFRIWKSAFPSINDEIGGYLTGNMYTWYGRSGRGKSVFTLKEAIHMAMQGANVLVWALEMPTYEVLSRIISFLSAEEGIDKKELDGVMRDVGFENKRMLMGELSEEHEAGLETFLSYIHEAVPGNIVIRGVDDEDFHYRNLKQLESDIESVSADVVVIDPFYYLDYETNTSKTAGGDAANTSKKIRHLAGRTRSVIMCITQADEIKDDRNSEGERELKAAKRGEIKKTKAVLEDAVNTFGIDTVDSLGIIELGKGRNGGEGAEVEILYLPNYGIVQELDTAGESNKFTEVF